MKLLSTSYPRPSFRFYQVNFLEIRHHSQPQFRRNLNKFLSIAALLFTFSALIFCLGLIVPAWAEDEDDLGNPERDGQLKAYYLDNDGDYQFLSLKSNSVTKIPFSNSDKIYFYYGIKRKNAADRKPGAIAVKVVYLYDSKIQEIIDWAQYTMLYRNELFPGRPKMEGAVPKDLYRDYHKGELANYTLRKGFHAIFPVNQKTDGTYQRKQCFLFLNEKPWDQEGARQKTYLIYYKGVNDLGTWVDFDVGVSMHMSNLLITITDLGDPGSDLGATTWQINRD